MSIVRVNEFTAAVGKSAELFDFLQTLVPYITGAAGCIACELLKHHEGFERIALGNDKLVKSIKVVKSVDEEAISNSIYLTRYHPHKAPIKTDLSGTDTGNVNFIRVEFFFEIL